MDNKSKEFILPKKLLVAISGFGFAMCFGAFFHITENREGFNWMLYTAAIFTLISVISAALHVIKFQDSEKTYWLLSFILLPFISPFVYFISRK